MSSKQAASGTLWPHGVSGYCTRQRYRTCPLWQNVLPGGTSLKTQFTNGQTGPEAATWHSQSKQTVLTLLPRLSEKCHHGPQGGGWVKPKLCAHTLSAQACPAPFLGAALFSQLPRGLLPLSASSLPCLGQGWLQPCEQRAAGFAGRTSLQSASLVKRCQGPPPGDRGRGQVTIWGEQCLERLTSVMLWIISELVTFSSHFSRRLPGRGFTKPHTHLPLGTCSTKRKLTLRHHRCNSVILSLQIGTSRHVCQRSVGQPSRRASVHLPPLLRPAETDGKLS